MTAHPRRTNAEFPNAPEAMVFRRACELAKIQPTRRQASKWRMRKGTARRFARQALEELSKEAHKLTQGSAA